LAKTSHYRNSVSAWASPTSLATASLLSSSASNDEHCAGNHGWAKVPNEVISAAQKAGGEKNVFKYPDEDLWHIGCTFGDVVYEIMNAWVSGLDGSSAPSPVGVFFAPSDDLDEGAAPVPPNEAMMGILREASAIVYHYAAMSGEDVVGSLHRPLPGPFKKPLSPVPVRHTKVALHALLGRIRTMNEPAYPTLFSLRSGSYICTVWISWAGAAQEVVVFKD
jgi:hypothetical protein